MSVSEIRYHSSVVVAVPVKDEADRIVSCLRALCYQSGTTSHQIVLLLNNCTDETAAIVKRLASSLPVPIHAIEITLPPTLANAGYARRLAMEAAADLVEPDGVLLTTDADGCVAPDWIALNLQALRRGADAVAGWIEIDPLEASLIPLKLHEDDERECKYANLLDQIQAELDPDPFDPFPRHSEHSGASIAVRVSAYRRAGGIPVAALGEDRAFFAALQRIDARIRHAPEVRVVVSGRTLGRAIGGMADTIRRRIVRPDQMIDDRLEPAMDAARRGSVRKLLRLAWSTPNALAGIVKVLSDQLFIASSELARHLSNTYFGSAWANIEACSAALVRRRVAVADLEYETAQARAILQASAGRRHVSLAGSINPADISVRDEQVRD